MLDKIINEIEDEIKRIEYENRDFVCDTCFTTLADLQLALPKLKQIKKDLTRIINKLLNLNIDTPEVREVKIQAHIFKLKYLLSSQVTK